MPWITEEALVDFRSGNIGLTLESEGLYKKHSTLTCTESGFNPAELAAKVMTSSQQKQLLIFFTFALPDEQGTFFFPKANPSIVEHDKD